jgi:hypothetical protein
MDDLTKQKIPIIIKEHILHTKIGYLMEAISKEKRKCKPIVLDRDKDNAERGSSVYVKHSAYEPINNIPTSDPTLKITRDANGVVHL